MALGSFGTNLVALIFAASSGNVAEDGLATLSNPDVLARPLDEFSQIVDPSTYSQALLVAQVATDNENSELELVFPEGVDKSTLGTFYRAVTRAAFEATYGDSLSPENVHNDEELRAALGGTSQTYQENYLQAAEEYFRGLSTQESDSVYWHLTTRPLRNGGGLLGAVQTDLINYMRGGRTPREGIGNPFFYAFHKLAEEGVIGADDAREWIQGAADITHGDESLESFYEAMKEKVDMVRENAPTVEVDAPELKVF